MTKAWKTSPSPMEEKLRHLAGALHEKKANNLYALDVTVYSSAFEGLILATAQSERHARSLADHLLEVAHEQNWDYLGMEGYQQAGWILLDFNDILVHIFQEEHRNLYNLEGFWNRGLSIALQLPENEHA
ncbi:ribosome silencing factor [Desulfonatronospira sp.]|uniref:ribosome silencing factor n=1 Tax=Desulfonatronospira sp. TaxID=1962951 RepID=UPI0025BBD3B5|nr:ribosome silencing factor [Desulfonatronospira sp.]